mgnify:CR=1 FL=1
MANLFSTMSNRIGAAIGGWLSPFMGGGNPTYEMPSEDLARRYATLRNYYNGDHTPQLKSLDGQRDHITQNWAGNIIDKGVSRLLRGDVKFALPETSTEQQEYIDKVYVLNKKPILLTQYALHGGVYGTPYFKICPDEVQDPFTSEMYPRLIALDPELVRIHVSNDDASEVHAYVISYTNGNKAHWEITYRSDMQWLFDANNNLVITHNEKTEEVEGEQVEAEKTWLIDVVEQHGGMPRQVVNSTPWEYPFPPILHQKNLPSLRNCYGDSDFDDIINIQDKSNFVVGNTNKIVKFFANPITFIFGISAKGMKENKLDSAVGSIYAIPDKDAKAMNLEMSSDLTSSRNLAQDLKKSIYEIGREVSMDSIGDNLGQLTNFALRVLYSDAVDKNETKRWLYADALKELNRRLLVLTDKWQGADTDPGDVIWGEALIINVKEEMETDQLALSMKVVDLETVTRRYESRYGVAYDDIQKKLADQAKAANANNSNIGAEILRRFNQGQGAENAQRVNGNADNNAARTIPAQANQ